jgi:S-(hydroxymethyl)glutathione dehydrogenase/alcohol dehydrogenase
MVDLYQSGQIDVDGLVTRTYTLDQINEAYEELDRGVVGRGIIAFQ